MASHDTRDEHRRNVDAIQINPFSLIDKNLFNLHFSLFDLMIFHLFAKCRDWAATNIRT